MDRHLHIVSFNVPYPPNYGSIIDVFYKMKALKRANVKVHLHCFTNGREEAEPLNEICESVNYYPVRKFYQTFFSNEPYMVGSRQNDDLLYRLIQDEHPILFEGLHTCSFLSNPLLKDRVKAVRMHHVEWDYYRSLGKAERNFFRRFYYFNESRKLKDYEETLSHADLIFSISKKDQYELKKEHKHAVYLPPFHPNQELKASVGQGAYALFHGNLQVIENNQAALYLISKVFGGMDVPFKIAGRNPLPTLKALVAKHPNVELIDDLDEHQLMEMIRSAHVNVLTSFQPSGAKLKLLNALYNGKFCVVNSRMVQNTGLEKLCFVENDHNKMKELITKLMKKDFTTAHLAKRSRHLDEHFSNQASVDLLVKQLFPVHQGSVLEYSA